MFTRVSSLLVALALVGFVAGCSKSPKSDYDSAKAALDSVRLAEVEQYAPAQFAQATDSLNAAVAEMEKQDGKFSMLRNYDRSKEMILAAQKLTEEAGTAAAAEKQRVRVRDSALVVEIDSLISQTRTSLSKAPRGKGSRVDLKVMQADIDAAAAALAVATAEYNAGRYLAARDQLDAVKAQVVRIKSDIDAASSRVSGK